MNKSFNSIVKKILGINNESNNNSDSWPLDIDPFERAIIERSRPFTMTSIDRMLSLCRALEYVLRESIPGDFVECGVWKGGSAMIAADYFLKANQTRGIWLYDSYEGMTVPSIENDYDYSGISASHHSKENSGDSNRWCYASLNEVKKNMQVIGYSNEKTHFIKGDVLKTIPSAGVPECISILRLDTDWYESTLHELEQLYHLVSPRGFIIIDDYGHWRGAQKAVDQFFGTLCMAPYMHRVDYTCRLIQKNQ